ncbi:MAG: sigma-70 family RNA polymerase sigma factor [Planctomycetes bacterium]|nr:sigma-70 family RNA polymerase sigma factor [Planctomycetota bacterium]
MDHNFNSKPWKTSSTLRLVQRAQLGDAQAFNEMLRRYQDQLLSFIFLRLGPRLRRKIEVEDIFQETVLRAFLSLKDLRWQNNRSFFQWLGAIAEHVIKNQVRYHFQTLKRGGCSEEEDARQEDMPVELQELMDSRQTSPSKALFREERFKRLEEALRSLKKDYREVIILARVRGLPIPEIARRMNRSADAVSMLLLRALRKLKSTFGDTDSYHLPPLSLEKLAGENGCSSSRGTGAGDADEAASQEPTSGG